MNRTMSDDEVLLALRPLQDAPSPSMAVDADATLRAGRSRRTRRTAVRGGIASLAVAAAGLGAIELAGVELGFLGPAASEHATQPARHLGDAAVVELAPGVLAANRPVERVLADGTEVLDLGITTLNFSLLPGTSWSELPTVLVPVKADVLAEHNASNFGPDFDAGVTQRNLVGDELGPFANWSIVWSSRESPRLVEDSPEWLALGESGGSYADVDTHVHAGKVPPWIPDPRVVVFSGRGYTAADGAVTHALELPTFASPGLGERLLYFVKIGPEQGFATPASGESELPIDATVYFGSDGEVAIAGGCSGTVERCGPFLGPHFADVVEEFGAP